MFRRLFCRLFGHDVIYAPTLGNSRFYCLRCRSVRSIRFSLDRVSKPIASYCENAR